jgi:KaiC/GvpD/RAD55 family RecA-like ATPase
MSSQHRPAVHSVHIYSDDNGLISRLCGIFATSLRMGDSALVIATAEHREQLVKSLGDAGINVRSCAREGRYTMLDADELLAQFMVDGIPDARSFERSVGTVLASAHQRARSRNRGVTAFGEMVAILWNNGEKEAALKVEDLWNEALRSHSFHLHCAYPRCIFDNVGDIDSVHSMHTHVVQ